MPASTSEASTRSPEEIPHPSVQRTDIRRLGRDTLLYSAAAILTRIVSFFMLPVYTRYLTPADYGLLSMLELALEIALILFSAGATAGLMRFFYKSTDSHDRNRVLFTAWATSMVLYAIGTVLLLLLAPLIWEHGLNGAGTLGMVRLAAVNFTLAALMLVPMQILTIEQRPVASSVILIAKLIFQLSLNIYFVVGLRAGPAGFLWSTFWSELAIGLGMTVVLLRRTGIAWSWPAFRDLRRFSLPIQLSKAGTFFLAFGDRFFLEKYHGLALVGLYGLAYQFGFILYGMLAAPFFQAWNPQRFQLLHMERTRRDALYNRGFLYGDAVVVTGAVAISLYIRPMLKIMTTVDFHSAAQFVPLIVLAYVIQAWTMVVDFGIEVSEKTKYTSMATWISVVIIAILYVLLIPPFGGMGAAAATLAAMLVRFAATLHFAQKLLPVSYNWGPHFRMILVGALVTIGAEAVPASHTLVLIATATAGFTMYLVYVWFWVLNRQDRLTLRSLAKAPRSLGALLREG